jgi:hypothetical protein
MGAEKGNQANGGQEAQWGEKWKGRMYGKKGWIGVALKAPVKK